MGVKYKNTNITPSITPNNQSIADRNGDDTVGPERRRIIMLKTNNIGNNLFPRFINL